MRRGRQHARILSLKLREQEITCREIVGANYRQVITCIKVYDGICASHLDIQVAKAMNITSRRALHLRPNSAPKAFASMPFRLARWQHARRRASPSSTN